MDVASQSFDVLKVAIIFLSSFLFSAIILPRLSHIAEKIGLIDQPNERKIHNKPMPLVGGLGMIMALSLTSLLFFPLAHLRGFFSGLIILTITGFLDDFKEIDHYWKFIAQAVAVTLMISFSKTVLLSFGDLFSTGQINLGIFAVPLTYFCVIGVINSINMIDGLDGLAGGLSLISLISFAILSYVNNQMELMYLSLGLGGAVLGFLIYNWPPSRLFMGDAGSLSLGFSLAFLSIAITQVKDSHVPPVAPLLILAIPIVDTVTVMIERILRGRSPFYADRTHIHHRLIHTGRGKKETLYIILSLSLLLNVIAVGGTILRIPEYYLFLVFGIYLLIYLVFRFIQERRLISLRDNF